MQILGDHILSIIVFLPLVGAGAIACLPKKYTVEMRIISLAVSFAVFVLVAHLALSFVGTGDFEFEEIIPWIPALNIHYRIGIDGTSLLMILMTAILTLIAIGCSWHEIDHRVKGFHALILIVETGMIGTFIALDAFLFYVFWEAVLIPLYFIVGIWGSGNRLRSATKFVIFTTLGSVIMLVGILYCAYITGGTFDIISWYAHGFPLRAQLVLFVAFALAFAIKLPVLPLHTWLPDAHTDAPTAGSILLAGVLLKMGAYGFYRLAMPLFPAAVTFFTPYLTALAVAAILYGGLVALVQTDMKRLIAYSSIAHMGFVLLGFFALNVSAAEGAIIQMFNHGITTGALFMMVGMIYSRTNTRDIAHYGGAARSMPLMATAFIVLALASAGLPGLSTFVGEFLVLLGSFQTRTWYTLAAIPGVIIAAVYMLWLIQRVFFGPMKGPSTENLDDMSVREHLLVIPLIALVVAVGVWPKPWLVTLDRAAQNFLTLATRGIKIENVIKPAPEPEPSPLMVPERERPRLFMEQEKDVMVEEGEEKDVKTEYDIKVRTAPPPPPKVEGGRKGGKVTLPPLPAGLDEEDW